MNLTTNNMKTIYYNKILRFNNKLTNTIKLLNKG